MSKNRKRGKRREPNAPKSVRDGTRISTYVPVPRPVPVPVRDEKKKVRKRGKRTSNPPKSFRDAAKRAAALALAAEDAGSSDDSDASPGPATQEDHILPSVENEPETGLAIEEEDDLLSEQDGVRRTLTRSASPRVDGAAKPSTIIDLTIDEAIKEEEDDEASGSRTPREAESSEPSESPSEGSVQPTGNYCIVICRLSSQNKQVDPTRKKTVSQRWLDYRQRRVTEGDIMAGRLAENCPTPVQFTEVWSYCGVCCSDNNLNWFKPETSSSEFVKSIRGWFRDHSDKHVTVLIRAVDGITTRPASFKSFLEMIHSFGVTAQLIFQWNKAFDGIRPIMLTPFLGLGSLAEFSSQEFLDHMNGNTVLPAVRRIVEIFEFVGEAKALQHGIQDRNGLMDEDAEGAEEVESLASSAGRRGRRAR